jgi:hypothetical protein
VNKYAIICSVQETRESLLARSIYKPRLCVFWPHIHNTIILFFFLTYNYLGFLQWSMDATYFLNVDKVFPKFRMEKCMQMNCQST